MIFSVVIFIELYGIYPIRRTRRRKRETAKSTQCPHNTVLVSFSGSFKKNVFAVDADHCFASCT